MITVLGIRHHGPGSAKSLTKALKALQPDCILIECPSDAESMLPFVANPNLKPPVALLIYNPKLLTQASYLPFAHFSPEWQAIKYALAVAIPVRCMDLPMNLHFTLDTLDVNQQQLRIRSDQELSNKDRKFRRDPLGHLAALAGYKDSERWWEITFESSENDINIFNTILEMMTVLRDETGNMEDTRTLQREAYMRKIIRKAIKDGFQNIAVVCGAWHAPVLHHWKNHKTATDNAILKGIKKTSTKATWVPWSYNRLTFLSGYGAGVLSPAWYEILFSNRSEVIARWMIKAARLFRRKDLDASAAHVIEAVRLAETLGIMRSLSIPGIEEMKEAAISTFCEGNQQQLRLIEEELVVGKKVGNVPPEIPAIPLQQDLEKTIKTARLSNYWQNTEELWLKANADNTRGGIDLREEKDLLKSHLLHRLNILNIPWGKLMKEGRYDLGSFKEYWKMRWRPEFSIKIIEAGMWGNTVYEAATNFTQQQIASITILNELTQLTERALNANLVDAIDPLIQKLQELAAVTQDVYRLMDALPALVRIIRYGNVRKTDIHAVQNVVQQMVPRICIGLPSACISLDEDATANAFDKILQTNRALALLNNLHFNQTWFNSLKSLLQMQHVNAKLKGLSLRMLFDKGIINVHDTTTQLRYALSSGNEPKAVASWIEGFLFGSGLLLIHNPSLWQMIDEWVNDLAWSDFEVVLPLLRRTFAQFPVPERSKMMQLAKQSDQITATVNAPQESLNQERAESVLPVVHLLLGKKSS